MLERASPPFAALAVSLAVLVGAIGQHPRARAPSNDRFLQIYLTNLDLYHPVYGFVDRSTVTTIQMGGEVRRTFVLEGERHSVRVFAHGKAGLWKWESWTRGTLVPRALAGADAAAFGIELDDDEHVFVVGELHEKTWTKYEGMRYLDELFP